MNVHHIAIWTSDLARLKDFYTTYFDCKALSKYRNESKNFESFFLRFGNDTQVELMQMPDIPENLNDSVRQYRGLIHFAISVGDQQEVIALTHKLKTDGFIIVSEPRTTGDGYFESCVLDPDGNRIEILA
jgi:lactoylglutathione lyase